MASSNKRRMLWSPNEAAGALQRMHITKRSHEHVSSAEDEPDEERRHSKRHSPERANAAKRVWATVVPINGQIQRLGIEQKLLRNLVSDQLSVPNQIVPHPSRPDEDLFLKMMASCLSQNKFVFVATPAGTVWRASLIQTLQSDLPCIVAPEIRIEEISKDQLVTEPTVKSPPIICELPALQTSKKITYASTTHCADLNSAHADNHADDIEENHGDMDI